MVVGHQQAQHGLRLIVQAGDPQPPQQGVLVGEMAVERAARHIGLDTDLLDAGVLYPLLLEQPVGGVLDTRADFEFALLPAPQWCHGCVHNIPGG